MTDCARCKKSIPRMSIEPTAVIMLKIQSYLSPTCTKYGVGNCLCYTCYNELFEEDKKERKHSEIECPDCEKKFILVAKKPKKTEELSLPWSLIKFKRKYPYVHCPYCQMKLPPDEIVDYREERM